jgi:formamidopyrimidine-DNA glycosylase
MPEGPEIRRAADRVANALEGKVADEVIFAFGRGGEPCRVCSSTVVSASVGGRTCSWCPDCQPQAPPTPRDGPA